MNRDQRVIVVAFCLCLTFMALVSGAVALFNPMWGLGMFCGALGGVTFKSIKDWRKR